MALIVRPSSARNETPRPAANAGADVRTHRSSADPAGPRLRREYIKEFAHALTKANKEGVAHERVADRHLVKVRQPAEQHQVIEIEVVPRVEDRKSTRLN